MREGEREKERKRGREGEKQEKQGRTSLFRGGCCGINSVKSRRADRVSETARDRGGRGVAGRRRGEERGRKRERKARKDSDGVANGWREGCAEGEILSTVRLKERERREKKGDSLGLQHLYRSVSRFLPFRP